MKVLKKILIALFCILLGCVFLFPIYILVVSSFKTQTNIFTNVLEIPLGDTFVISNYPAAIDKMEFASAIINSLVITIASTAAILVFGSMAAWVLVRNKTRISGFIYLMFAATMLVPFQCVMLPLIQFMRPLGFLNRPGLVFMYLGFGAGLAIMMFHGFIKNIPLELEEAATIDGCGTIRTFFLIVFPLLKTILVTVAVLNIMWIWNDYLLPSLVLTDSESKTIPLQAFSFFSAYATRWDLGTAALVLSIMPVIIFYLFAQKMIVKGVTEGAIK